MIYLLGFFISFLFAAFRGTNRIAALISCVTIVIMTGVNFPTFENDYENYLIDYNLSGSIGYISRMEWSYRTLVLLSKNLGLDYHQFRSLFAILVGIVLFIAINRLSDNPADFFWMFMIFPFINEATQIRFFMMFSLILCAASCLKFQMKLFDYIKVSFLVLLGMSFHSSGIVFILIIPFSMFLNKKNINKSLERFSIISISAFFVFGYILKNILGGFFSEILSVFTSNQLVISSVSDRLNAQNMSVFSGLMYLITYFGLIFFILKVSQDKDNEQMNLKTYQLKIIISISILSFVLMANSDQYVRLLRVGIVAACIIYSNYLNKLRYRINTGNQVVVLKLFMVVMLIITGTLYYGVFTPNNPITPTIPKIMGW